MSWFTFTWTPLRDDDGVVAGFHCAANETTERVLAEQSLHGAYQTLLQSIDDGFCIIELMFDEGGHVADYRIVETNAAFERQSGLAGACGRRIRELLPDLEPFWFEAFGRVARSGRPERIEYCTQGVASRWYDVRASRVGEPWRHRLAILFNEITERKRTEQGLQTSEARYRARDAQYRAVFATMDQGYLLADVIFDAAGKAIDMAYVETNAAAIGMTGVDMTGKRLREVSTGYEDYWFEIYGRVARTGVGERHQLYAAPNRRWYDFQVFKPDPDNAGSHRVAVLFSDITERQRTEAALRASEARERFLLSFSDATRSLIDAAQIQRTASRMLGEHLQASRTMYAELQGEGAAAQCLVRGQFVLEGEPFPQTVAFPDFIEGFVDGSLRQGEVVAIADCEHEPRLGEQVRQVWRDAHIRALSPRRWSRTASWWRSSACTMRTRGSGVRRTSRWSATWPSAPGPRPNARVPKRRCAKARRDLRWCCARCRWAWPSWAPTAPPWPPTTRCGASCPPA